jgi:hypothetical protein
LPQAGLEYRLDEPILRRHANCPLVKQDWMSMGTREVFANLSTLEATGEKETVMAERKEMLTAVFRDRVNAQTAYDRLVNRGYTNTEINVLMSDTTRSTYYTADKDERHDMGTHAAEGMGVGGAIGTAVGATLGAVMAIGTSLAIPGFGLVIAGPLAAAFAGGGAGAVTGGLIGALVGLGLPEPSARAYQEALREGGVVLGVVPRSSEDAVSIKEDFKDLHGENVCYC